MGKTVIPPQNPSFPLILSFPRQRKLSANAPVFALYAGGPLVSRFRGDDELARVG